MPTESFWHVAPLIFAAFLIGIRSSNVAAQKSDDLELVRRQVEQLDHAGKHLQALALQRRLAAKIEKAETASVGAPGTKTVEALVGVAWYALLARDFKQALAASNRAHSLAPSILPVETNRAHALLLLGRSREAQAIYLAHKGKPISLTSNQIWEDAIADDIESLRKAGINEPALELINRALGGKSSNPAAARPPHNGPGL